MEVGRTERWAWRALERRNLCLGSRMKLKWGGVWRGAEKCGRRSDCLGAEGKLWRVGPGKVGSRWGLDTGKLPAPQSQLRWLHHRAEEERIPRAGSPSPLPPLSFPSRKTWRGPQGGAESGSYLSPSELGTHCSLAVRPEDGAPGDGEEARTALQVAPPRSLKFAAGEGTDSVLLLPPARSSARPHLGGSSAHFPLGSHPTRSRIPSGLHPSPRPRAPRSLPPLWISRTT